MEAVFLTLLEVSAASAVVILAVMVLSSLINRSFTAKWKYWLWMVLAVRLLVPFNPSFESAPARVEVSIPAAPITLPAAAAVPAPSGQPAGPSTVMIGISEPVTTAPTMTTVELLMLVWLAGAVVFVLWQLVSYLRFCRQVKRWGLPIERDSLIASLRREVKGEFGIRGKIPALVCGEVSSPMMIGFFRPLLLLPREEYSQRELTYILRHELTHWKRRDIWYKALLLLANAVHWFNPAVWLMVREASRDLEISCDAAVMKNAGMEERREYSEIILACVHRELRVKTALSTHFYGGKKALKERFANILSTRKRRAGVIAFAVAVLCGGVIGGLVACSAAAPGGDAPGPRIPLEDWSYISSFSDPLPDEYEHPQLVCKDDTAAWLARAISPLDWFISTAQPPSFDASHPLDADIAARIAFDNTPRLDFGRISFGPEGVVCENYPDHPITKRLAQLWEEGRVPCDVIYADDAAAALERLFGVTGWEHHTVEFYDYFPEEGVYITYGDLVRRINYPLVLSWQETANGYSCEVVSVNSRSNSIDGVEVTEENVAELAQRAPHFVFTFDMTNGEPVVTGFAGGALQPQPLPLSITLSQETPAGYQLWGLLIDDQEELALVAGLLSTQYLTPSAPEDAAWPDGNTSIDFEIEYEDHTVTGACNPQDSSDRIDNGDTRLRTFEDGVFYNYPRVIGVQLLAFLDSRGFDVGSWWKENPDTEDEPENDDQGPWENIDTSGMYTDEENAARERERNFYFEIDDAFSQGLSKESYSYYTSYGEGDGDEMQLVLEIGVTDEAVVDRFLASWTGTKWDRLVKKPGTVSQAAQEEFSAKVEQLNLGPNVYLFSRPETGNHGGENGKILVSLNLDLYAPLEEVERWSEMPQEIIDFAAENGIPENMLSYMAPRYTPPGSNPDT